MEVVEYTRHLSSKLIEDFRRVYYDKIGVMPIVLLPRTANYIELGALEEFINVFIPVELKDSYPTIKVKRRIRELADLRKIFSYIAYSMGYTLKKIAVHLGQDHTTVLHNIHAFRVCMDISDQFQELYYTITENLKTHADIDVSELVPPAFQEGAYPKSILRTMELPAENQVLAA